MFQERSFGRQKRQKNFHIIMFMKCEGQPIFHPSIHNSIYGKVRNEFFHQLYRHRNFNHDGINQIDYYQILLTIV